MRRRCGGGGARGGEAAAKKALAVPFVARVAAWQVAARLEAERESDEGDHNIVGGEREA